MDIRPGDNIFGKDNSENFKIIEFINGGAFGAVFKIKEEKTGEIYALKTILTGHLDGDKLKALINEGRLASTIKHENVVDVIFFHDGSQYPELPPYIIIEYLPSNLKQLLDTQKKTNVCFDNNQLSAMFLQLAEGMKTINLKLIHRDVKPDNILFSENTLKISDFGLSKVVGAATRTQTFKGIQHIQYMAPEAWRLETNTIQMDIYSMGIVFYELATLTHPYNVNEQEDFVEAWKNAHFYQTAQIPKTKNTNLDNHLSQVIVKMISKKPVDRYPNWEEIIKRIQMAQTETESKVNVEKLVEKTLQTKEKKEKEMLKLERKEKEKEELEKAAKFKSEELVAALNEIVNAFNESSDVLKISMQQQAKLASGITQYSAKFSGEQGIHSVSIHAETVYEDVKFEGKQIKVWGYFINSNGKGFNVLLVLDNQEDIYGSWLCFDNKQIQNLPPRLRIQGDNRPDPFPFGSFEEFCKNIIYEHRLSIYETEYFPFAKEMLVPLFEDVL